MGDARSDAGHWVRMEADGLLKDMPEADIVATAEELEAKAEVFEGGRELACDVAAELRRRAAAGVRFWPALRLLDSEELSGQSGGGGPPD